MWRLLSVAALATADALTAAPTMLRAHAHHAAGRPAAATPRTEVPVMVLPLSARLALSVPTMYALMSVNEYVTHRYFQHAEFNREPALQKLWCFFSRQKEAPKIRGGGHVEHHAETYDDMSLKNDARWSATPASKSLDSDVFRGTAFSWQVTGLMTIQMLPTALPAFALLGFNIVQSFAVLLPGMLRTPPSARIPIRTSRCPTHSLTLTLCCRSPRPPVERAAPADARAAAGTDQLRRAELGAQRSAQHAVLQVDLREPHGPPRPRRPGARGFAWRARAQRKLLR